jgi:DNA invertase Pin-like site-specific DNA recombinase
LNGSLTAYWKTIAGALENAREDLDEREFAALSLAVARNLGLAERRSSRGRPPATIPADVVEEVLQLRSANGHLSEREISSRVGISRRQVKSILRRA